MSIARTATTDHKYMVAYHLIAEPSVLITCMLVWATIITPHGLL